MAERLVEVDAASLRRRCDPATLGFATTDELADLDEVPGQERAVEAIDLGLAMAQPGFNLFVLGPTGTGRHTLARAKLERLAAGQAPASDWAYVHDFHAEQRPRALELPPGRGARLASDMEELVDDLRTALATAFESDDYQSRRQALENEFKQREHGAFTELGTRALAKDLLMMRTPLGVAFVPSRRGEALSPQEFEAAPEADRRRFESAVVELKGELERLLRQLPRWQRERRERLRSLDDDVARFAVGARIAELRERYGDLPAVVSYLDDVEADVVRRAPAFVASESPAAEEVVPGGGGALPFFRRYQVNLLVDQTGVVGAPVVWEDHPTYANLCGRIEHLSQMGTLVTDFTLIKPGALHRANGGYLVVDALELLRQPFAWEALKRALHGRKLRIESLGQSLSLVSTVSLEPEPIPLRLKVVLVGERALYHLLDAYDPDFEELFKIPADFEDRMTWTDENQALFSRLVATLARANGLAAFDRGAVARAIEEAARDAGDSERLSLRTARLRDLLCEADHARRAENGGAVSAADVERAIAARERRAGRVSLRVREETLRDLIRVETAGDAVGQVNALAYVDLGDFAFGHPARVTARVRLGGGEVVDIEREVELGGPLHSKGVLILAGFLGGRYAAEQPLSLAATVVFEQSYGTVEGDSASLAELCALLSAVAEAPVSQAIAVTGSVDQLGRVQAVGAVDEKVEGFFDLCAERGLDGRQGVIVPASCSRRLMLRRDVVEAVAAGRFHLWPVADVDQAMERLTGREAGARGEDGLYPPESLNGAIVARLAVLAELRRRFGAGSDEEGAAAPAPG